MEYFVKRITPRDVDYDNITGGMRRALRSLAGRLKNENLLAIRMWPSSGPSVPMDGDLMEEVDSLPLNPSWMEDLDACLWQKELVQLRLNNAVTKKKGAKRLGERIATELDAHVAQVVGHTVLLYRPGIPPVLNLQDLRRKSVLMPRVEQEMILLARCCNAVGALCHLTQYLNFSPSPTASTR